MRKSKIIVNNIDLNAARICLVTPKAADRAAEYADRASLVAARVAIGAAEDAARDLARVAINAAEIAIENAAKVSARDVDDENSKPMTTKTGDQMKQDIIDGIIFMIFMAALMFGVPWAYYLMTGNLVRF